MVKQLQANGQVTQFGPIAIGKEKNHLNLCAPYIALVFESFNIPHWILFEAERVNKTPSLQEIHRCHQNNAVPTLTMGC